MIPDLAIIVSTYAVARLLNEYLFEDDSARGARIFVTIAALAAIVIFCASIVSTANSINDLDLGI